ncbi:MAG: hypothetical protein LCH91_05450 [Bacteroidetes bacterium]|nr:hypothetical protein [Bacteroidota bacterium]
MYIWKTQPFEVPSTDRTAAPKLIVGIEVGFYAGKVAVTDNHFSPVTLVIDYYDSEGRKREYLTDKIDADIIRAKASQLGIEGENVEAWVKATMDIIVKYVIGGADISERHASIAQLAAMFGQELLPIEAQTGTI